MENKNTIELTDEELEWLKNVLKQYDYDELSLIILYKLQEKDDMS
jgi:hypothetical protein